MREEEGGVKRRQGRQRERDERKRRGERREIAEKTKRRFRKREQSGVLSEAAVSETCQRIRDLDSVLLPRSLSLMNV